MVDCATAAALVVEQRRAESGRAEERSRGIRLHRKLSDNEMERMLPIIKGNGVEANDCKISFSLDAAIYSDTLQWYRGNLLHPDPEVPNKWIPVKRTAQ